MIHWHITEQQADQVLNILAARPFNEVSGLIGELLRQAQAEKHGGKALEHIAKPNGHDTPAEVRA